MQSYEKDIFELKQQSAKLERQITFLFDHLGLDYPDEPDQGVSPVIMELVRQGRKVAAVKQYRHETGVGLREAKEFVDSLEDQM